MSTGKIVAGVLLGAGAIATAVHFTRWKNVSAFDDLIKKHAQANGIEPSLVKAVIATESGFDPAASRFEPHLNDSSFGLMQVLTHTAGDVGVSADELKTPEGGIIAGTRYLRIMFKTFNGDEAKAIMAYNAGPGRIGSGHSNWPYWYRVKFNQLALELAGKGIA